MFQHPSERILYRLYNLLTSAQNSTSIYIHPSIFSERENRFLHTHIYYILYIHKSLLIHKYVTLELGTKLVGLGFFFHIHLFLEWENCMLHTKNCLQITSSFQREENGVFYAHQKISADSNFNFTDLKYRSSNELWKFHTFLTRMEHNTKITIKAHLHFCLRKTFVYTNPHRNSWLTGK